MVDEFVPVDGLRRTFGDDIPIHALEPIQISLQRGMFADKTGDELRLRRTVSVDRCEYQLCGCWLRQQAQSEIVLPPGRNRLTRHQAGKAAPVEHDDRAPDRQRFERGAGAREHEIAFAKKCGKVVDFISGRRSHD